MHKSTPTAVARLLLIACALGAVGVLASAAAPEAADRRDDRLGTPGAGAGEAGGAIVLELFTSQGCSSCPPADRLLSELGDRLGDRVVPLAFHVDYWNHIGWRDPFSSSAWSDRQHAYARAMAASRVYTPQLVIDGVGDCVGSSAECVERWLRRRAEEERPASVAVAARRQGERIGVHVLAEWHGEAGDRPQVVRVALFESGLTTPVERGENARRTLDNDFVVRVLEDAGRLAARPGSSRRSELAIDLDSRWEVSRLGVAAFLQDPQSFHIHGAAVAPVASP